MTARASEMKWTPLNYTLKNGYNGKIYIRYLFYNNKTSIQNKLQVNYLYDIYMKASVLKWVILESTKEHFFYFFFFSGELQCSFSHYFGMYCLFARCYSLVVMVGGKMLHGLQHCSEFMLSLCHQLRTLCCPSGSCPDPAAAGVPALLRSRTLLCSRRWEPWQCQLHHHFSSSAKWSCTQWVEAMSQCMTPSYRHSSHFQNTSFLSLEGCSRSIFPPCLAPLAVKWYE